MAVLHRIYPEDSPDRRLNLPVKLTTLDMVARSLEVTDCLERFRLLNDATDQEQSEQAAENIADFLAEVEIARAWPKLGNRNVKRLLMRWCEDRSPTPFMKLYHQVLDLSKLTRSGVKPCTGEVANSAQEFKSQANTSHWKEHCSDILGSLALTTAETDILNMLDRVIVQQRGWARSDSLAAFRLGTAIIPFKMTKHGFKAGRRSYERAIPSLVRKGLIIKMSGRDEYGHKMYQPAWDPRVTSNPVLVFQEAAERVRRREHTPKYWRRPGVRKADDPVRR